MRDQNRKPTHPGALLREDILPSVDVSKIAIAKGLGISRQHFYDILNEKKPVSAEVAVRLAAMFGGTALSWMQMQTNLDAWNAEQKVDVADIPKIADLAA